MTLEAILIAAILSLPSPWYKPGANPETPEQYRARATLIATAVALEVPDLRSGLLVLNLFRHESAFHLSVHSGAKKGDAGQSVCLGQNKRHWLSEAQHEALMGTDLASTRRCAKLTHERLMRAERLCRTRSQGGPAGAYSLYGTGATCQAPWAKVRGYRFQLLWNKWSSNTER